MCSLQHEPKESIDRRQEHLDTTEPLNIGSCVPFWWSFNFVGHSLYVNHGKVYRQVTFITDGSLGSRWAREASNCRILRFGAWQLAISLALWPRLHEWTWPFTMALSAALLGSKMLPNSLVAVWESEISTSCFWICSIRKESLPRTFEIRYTFVNINDIL